MCKASPQSLPLVSRRHSRNLIPLFRKLRHAGVLKSLVIRCLRLGQAIPRTRPHVTLATPERSVPNSGSIRPLLRLSRHCQPPRFCERLSNQLSNELREIVEVLEAEMAKARRRANVSTWDPQRLVGGDLHETERHRLGPGD